MTSGWEASVPAPPRKLTYHFMIGFRRAGIWGIADGCMETYWNDDERLGGVWFHC